jgi:hypothetical protein
VGKQFAESPLAVSTVAQLGCTSHFSGSHEARNPAFDERRIEPSNTCRFASTIDVLD